MARPVDPLDRPPFPYGLGAATEGFSSTASPLFAGFSSALVALVLTAQPGTIRWASWALAMHTAATVAFIIAVQCGLWARGFVVSRTEIAEWWPGVEADRLRSIHRLHRQGFRIWRRRFHAAYRIGILLFLLGLAIALVPPGNVGAGRAVAIGAAVLGLVAECIWIAANEILKHEVDYAVDEPSTPEPAAAASLNGEMSRVRRALMRAARVVIPVVRVERPRD